MSNSFKYGVSNIKSGSREYSKDSSQHTAKSIGNAKNQQSSHMSKGNLHNPKVIRQVTNKSSESRQYLHALMSSTGTLVKSQGDNVVESNNQTIIHNDSSNQEYTTTYATEKLRNKSATYMRDTDAYDNLDRNMLMAGSETNLNPGREISSKSPSNQTSFPHGFESFGFNAFYNHLKESQNSRTIQQGFDYPELSQTIDQNEVHNNRKMLYQSLASKSSCTTARGHGPTVASGPLNPLGNKQNGAPSNSNQRHSQMRQSACGMAQKVTKTASRKGF